MKRKSALALAIILILAGCSKKEIGVGEEATLKTNAALSAIFPVSELSYASENAVIRPGYSLGPFVSLYLSQNQILKSSGALEGIDVQIRLFRSDSQEKDETFSLLEAYGTVLQVDIVDTLNRSAGRAETLEKYLVSLSDMNGRIKTKQSELKQKLETADEKRRQIDRETSDKEREIRNALKDKNYSSAGPKQEELTVLQKNLAEAESRTKQIKDKLSIIADLLKIGEARQEAIEKNREILIAGLKIIDVPGLEELGLFVEE